MAKVRFYPLDITYKVIDDKPVIYIFGRADDGNQLIVLDDTFRPYFYACLGRGADQDKLREDIKKIAIEDSEHIDRKIAVLDADYAEKALNGEQRAFIRVLVPLPKDISPIKDRVKGLPGVEGIYEADIPFIRRYLVDKNITPLTLAEAEGEYINYRSKVSVMQAKIIGNLSDDAIENPRILSIDIETYAKFGKQIIPEENPILMIALYSEDMNKVITWKRFKTNLEYVEFVESEAEMINRFKELVEEHKPDMITGYYSDGFDFPYIKTRADKNSIKLDLGLDYAELDINTRANNAQITGIVHFDIFKFIRKVIGPSMDTETYGLGTVAYELIGEKKQDIDISRLADVWDKNPEELENFCSYNLHDAVLTHKLCKKFLPNIIELTRITGLPPFELNRMGFSQLVEGYIMKQSPNFNEIILPKPDYNMVRQRRLETYKGAFVFQPSPGLYNNLVMFDFRSLYPTIIGSHNISQSTLNCSCCRDAAEHAPVEGKDYWFCTKKKGFIAKLIEDLVTRRMRIKEIIKEGGERHSLLDARQNSLKLLANSFYGYFAFFGARWYSIECARSITAWGRYYIQRVINSAKESGFNVVYSDTDSVLMTLDEKTKEDALKFVEAINRGLPGLMELEFEGIYLRGIFVSAKEASHGAKKKYALLSLQETIKIVGFETVRRNWSLIAKETQEQVINIILRENDKEKALRYVKRIIAELRQNRVLLAQVVIYTQLQKDIRNYDSVGPHVRAAMRMRQKGIPVGPGTMVRFVVTRGKERIGDRARLPEEVGQEDYDPDYYINNQVIPSVERILNVLGYEKEELLEERDQSKLQKFF